MAKFIASVCRAIWLVVVLAVLVRVAQAPLPRSCFSPDSSCEYTKLENPINDGWRNMLKICRHEAPRKSRPQIMFLAKLEVFAKENSCTEEIRNTLIDVLAMAKSKNKRCFKSIQEYLPLYLQECDFEENFRKGPVVYQTKSFNTPTYAGHATLFSYIEEKFLLDTVSKDFSQLKLILSALERTPQLLSSSREIVCTRKLEKDLIKLTLENISANVRYEPRDFRGVNFGIFLDKCGYEEILGRRVEHMKQVSIDYWDSDLYPTLYSYFDDVFYHSRKDKSEDGQIDWAIQHLSSIRAFSSLERTMSEPQCKETLRENLLWLIEACKPRLRELHKLYKDYFRLYLDKCGLERLFKEVIEGISHEYWDPQQCSTLSSYLEAEFWQQMSEDGKGIESQLKLIIDIIKELSKLNGITKKTQCADELKNKLLVLRDQTEQLPKLQGLVDGHLALYLSSCGYEGQFEKSH